MTKIFNQRTDYIAYEIEADRPVAILRRGSYEKLRAWADKQQAAYYRKHQIHKPIWVDAIRYPLAPRVS